MRSDRSKDLNDRDKKQKLEKPNYAGIVLWNLTRSQIDNIWASTSPSGNRALCRGRFVRITTLTLTRACKRPGGTSAARCASPRSCCAGTVTSGGPIFPGDDRMSYRRVAAAGDCQISPISGVK